MGFLVDDLLELKASAAVTSSAAGSLIIDLGAGSSGVMGHAFTTSPRLVEGAIVIDVSALDIATNDEGYDIVLQGSPDAAFGTAANIVELVALHIGAKEVKRTDSDADDATGRYILPFRNERNGVIYRYVRIYTVVAAAGSSITYAAWLTKAGL